jgi:hypothetical protein
MDNQFDLTISGSPKEAEESFRKLVELDRTEIERLIKSDRADANGE